MSVGHLDHVLTVYSSMDHHNYSNTVIGTLAGGGWAVTFGIARRELGRAAARLGPSSLYRM